LAKCVRNVGSRLCVAAGINRGSMRPWSATLTMPERPQTIWTIGHSTHTIEAFLGILRAHRIEVIADVRLLPGSRRYPQFNRELLSSSLQKIGIEYMHVPELGGRRKPRPDSPHTAWRNDSFRGYADHMDTEEFRRGIAVLEKSAASQRVAVMCAEAIWWRCHRSLIADWMKASGVEVRHILSENKIEPHPFTSAAQLIDGRLSYRAPREDATHAELPL
jgi:uncharacterized protein (DUF488 family)